MRARVGCGQRGLLLASSSVAALLVAGGASALPPGGRQGAKTPIGVRIGMGAVVACRRNARLIERRASTESEPRRRTVRRLAGHAFCDAVDTHGRKTQLKTQIKTQPVTRRFVRGALSTAVVLALLALLSGPALAGGGTGGGVAGAGGTGGAGFTGAAGGNGGVSGGTSSGGGGGGAAGGGNGGSGGNAGGGSAAGGAGGSVLSPNGQAGSAGGGGAAGEGGGGGGGGYNGNGAGAATVTNTSPLSGGNGGSGGDALTVNIAGGGGGGAGGYGAIVTGSGTSSNTSSISGGTGGAGGQGGGVAGAGGGNGGDGGVGVQFTATGATFTNSGTVTGGNGGAGGIATVTNGSAGAGGAGIVGSGLTVINSGTVTGGLSGDGATQANAITFTGSSNILELQAGSSISGNVVGTGADTLRFGGAANASFNLSNIGGLAQYQGFSTFIKTGTSTWTLTGSTSAPGDWSINQGTLEVDGAIGNATSVTVNSGGALSGTGLVDPPTTTIMSGGTLAPGNASSPTGTLSITGNLAFQSGALYVVQVTPSSAASTIVSGTATLTGATVNAQFASGSYLAKQYTILTASGLGGTTFASLTNSNLPSGFTDSLSYSGTDVLLNLTASLGQSSSSLPTGGLNPNQQNVANGLNNFFNFGGTLPPNFVNIFGLSGGTLGNALTQLDGEAATDAQKGASQLMTQFLDLMLDPTAGGGGGTNGGGATGFAPEQDASLPADVALAYAKALKAPQPQAPQTFEQRWTAWGSGFGGTSFTNGNAAIGSNNVTASDYGFAAGMDYHATPDTLYGFALAGGGTNWNLAQALGSGRSDAFQAGIYAKTHWGPFYFSGALAFANHWFTTNRIAMDDQLRATFMGQSYAARGEVGYRYAVPITGAIVGVTPYAALQAQDFHTPSYSETDLTGGGFALSYNSMNATDTRSELGARFDNLRIISGMPLVLRGRLAWAHDWFTDATALNAVFETLPGSNFTVNGAAPPKNSALTTAAAELHINANWTAIAKFDGAFGSGSQTYGGTGTLRYSW
jgi:uncharacterized protein with beta-barrel porin domain